MTTPDIERLTAGMKFFAVGVVECFMLGIVSAIFTAGILWFVPVRGPFGFLVALACGNGLAFGSAFGAVSLRLALRDHLEKSNAE